MTIEEIFNRIVRGHLLVILVCALLPVGLVLLTSTGQQVQYKASVRIQVGADSPVSTTEADGISSRVLALSTTPALLRFAIAEAGVSRNADTVANEHVSAQRLGESSVVELSVTDANKEAAKKLVSALGVRVTQFMNEGDQAQFSSILANVDQRLRQGAERRNALAEELALATLRSDRETIKLQLENLDQTMGQLSDQRTALMVSDASRDQAVVVDANSPDLVEVPSGLLPRTALALLLGLVLGVTVAAGIETFRPRIPDSRSLARMLDAPLLGTSHQRPVELVRVISLATRRQGLSTVVLVPADPRDATFVEGLIEDLGAIRRGEDGGVPDPRAGSPNMPVERRYRDHDGDDSRQVKVDKNAAEDVMQFGDVTYTGISEVKPWDELVAGVVVVSSGRILRARYEDLVDLIQASRWPVIGLLDAAANPWSWRWGRQRP
jgi:capsular polysaccharide biosynthesis protein